MTLLEIVGFWTPSYLEEKLRRLRAARLGGMILCIDASRDCGRAQLPEGARILGFRRRVDAAAVLAMLEAQ